MHSLSIELAVDAQAVARRFGARWVLRGASLSIRAGEVAGLVGANGSGKSTLLRVLCTLLRPTAGSASVFGADVVRDADAVRASVGFFAPVPGVYEDLTARENLRFAARMLGRDAREADGMLERVSLAHVADERVRGFSSGMMRRLSLARLLVQSPRLLLLDEPYNNFDVAGIALVNETIRDTVARGGAALVVVHDVASAVPVVGSWFALDGGRVAAAGSEPPAESYSGADAALAGAAGSR